MATQKITFSLLIEGYVCLTAITLSFLAVFGSIRRRSHNPWLRKLIRAAYVLSTCFISYTVGQMQSFDFTNKMFAVWAIFFLTVLGSTDTITAFSIEDNEKLARYNLQIFVQFFWIWWLIISKIDDIGSVVLYSVALCLTLFRIRQRGEAMKRASRSSGLAKNTKVISDFMAYEHTLSNEEVKPDRMRGYNYLVLGEDDKNITITPPDYRKKLKIDGDDVVTVSKVWGCNGRLLTSRGDPDGKLKDVILSYALFRLLCRRFAGYPFLESNESKTWKFVCGGLISDGECDGARAFRVIEVELSFLYDLFYTKDACIFRKSKLIRRIIHAIIVMSGFWFPVLVSYIFIVQKKHYMEFNRRTIDIEVTGLAVLAILFVEIVQIISLLFSDWLKVILVSNYVITPSLQRSKVAEKIMKFVCHTRWFKPWERKLGQYSLLKSLDHKNILEKAYWNVESCTLSLFTCVFGIGSKRRKGIEESSRIKLPNQVIKAVTSALKTINNRRLTNGETSLKRNLQSEVFDKLSWAVNKLESHTHLIIVWHVATSLCEIEYSPNNDSQVEENFRTATSLSKYCAYLAVFAPRLLPDHAFTTALIVDHVIIEARSSLKHCKSLESMKKKLMEEENTGKNTIIGRGGKLGKLLIEEIRDNPKRWEVLSQFWAELILFLSPSDDCNAHAEYLARGGELVTHLWTLLSHAGILQRPASDPQIAESNNGSTDAGNRSCSGGNDLTEKNRSNAECTV